jgi:hypothetical protein
MALVIAAVADRDVAAVVAVGIGAGAGRDVAAAVAARFELPPPLALAWTPVARLLLVEP